MLLAHLLLGVTTILHMNIYVYIYSLGIHIYIHGGDTYIHIYIYLYLHIYIYIYTYVQRGRENCQYGFEVARAKPCSSKVRRDVLCIRHESNNLEKGATENQGLFEANMALR